ncbi:cupin [Candidatus Shapirobacteria bacterium CG07_land_8_20_14_0_80_39_12]|uniref:Cupin n=2 Tax=Candidatus Shapironibacteriota TaxID=1752721 RepID=A0A2M6YPU1_9BACT|nr:MAG: cupin [Candidatus Shapirobacteria bacterium CG07_land_8_20_14_0_80_39_12]PJA49890.1 MAG: cupin [Candidatus Shapirobacteria bacterium CG_4_9_14_3_um_filter_39_13]
MELSMEKAYSVKINKPWGYEIIFTPPDSPVTGKILHLNQGARFSYQYHEKKTETLCLLNGRAKIILNDEEIEMEPQKGYFIKPIVKHRCQAITDCDLLEASTKEEGTTVRLQDDYQRPDETDELRKQPHRGWTG